MKHIVYKTTNLVNNYIYIGVHKTNDPDTFDGYIGCGVNIKVPYTYQHAKTKFQQAVKQFGTANFKREVLAIFDTPEEAYSLESELVDDNFLARSDVYNTIRGGIINQTQGIKVYQYDLKGNYLNEYNSYEDAGKSLNVQPSSIRRAVVYKYKIKEFYFSNDKLEKLDISTFSNIEKVIVYRYLKNGQFDTEFESYNEAARQSDSSPSNIRSATMEGYCVRNSYYFSFIKEASFDIAKTIQIKSRPVHKYNSNGIYIKSYDTQEEAEKQNKGSNITKAICLKQLDANGFMWSLEKLPKYNCPKPKNRKKKVGKYDDDGNLLQQWDSARKCAADVGTSVQNVLNGKYPKHKGFVYKYIDN